MRVVSDSSDGYPREDYIVRAFLVISHALLIPQMLIAWRVREAIPWLLYSMMSCLLASSSYHICYSFGVCVLSEPLHHRQLDHFCSQLYAVVLFTTFLWRRKDSRIQKHTDDGDTEGEFTIQAWWTKDTSNFDSNSERLEFYRPWIVDPFIFILYVAKAYTQLRQGIYGFNFFPFFAIAMLTISIAHITEILAFGLQIRSRKLAIFVAVLTVVYGALLENESLGALGHSFSHVVGFSIGWPYLRHGPIFQNADGTFVCLGHSQAQKQ